METFSCKISIVENNALNHLSNLWRCNRAEAARKSIRLAMEKSNMMSDLEAGSNMLIEIIQLQKNANELLQECAKYTPMVTRLDRIEEYTVQACLSAGVLAKQSGLFELARNEYITWKQKKVGGK